MTQNLNCDDSCPAHRCTRKSGSPHAWQSQGARGSPLLLTLSWWFSFFCFPCPQWSLEGKAIFCVFFFNLENFVGPPTQFSVVIGNSEKCIVTKLPPPHFILFGFLSSNCIFSDSGCFENLSKNLSFDFYTPQSVAVNPEGILFSRGHFLGFC